MARRNQVVPDVSSSIAADPAGGLFSACTGICSRAQHRAGPHRRRVDHAEPRVAPLAASSTVPVLSVGKSGEVYVALDQTVVRVESDGTMTTIAGNGSADTGNVAQQGEALALSLTPMGLATTKNDGLLVSSGHVVYRLDHPRRRRPRPRLPRPCGCPSRRASTAPAEPRIGRSCQPAAPTGTRQLG